MKTIVTTFFLFISISLLMFSPVYSQFSSDAEYVPGTLIIKFESDTFMQDIRAKSGLNPMDDINDLLFKIGAGERRPVWNEGYDLMYQTILAKRKMNSGLDPASELKRTFEITISSSDDLIKLANRLSKMPGIAYAEPRYIYHTQEIFNDPIANVYHDFHRFDEAWEISENTENVIIGVVDSGVDYLHEDLSANMWVNENEVCGNGQDDDGNGIVDDCLGVNFMAIYSNFFPEEKWHDPRPTGSDHGTHVAGITAATPDNGLGITGSGLHSRIMAIKVGGPLGQYNRSIFFGYDGILYAVNNGAHVVNNSWGGSNFSQFGLDVVTYAEEMGVLVIAASGNANAEGAIFPAAYPTVLSVGSVDRAYDTFDFSEIRRKASYSNYGLNVDVHATGSSVQAPVFDPQGQNCTTCYGAKTGTSMASPVVAGLSGLILAKYPDWAPERVRLQIRSTASNMDIDNFSLSGKLGTGSIDAFKAVSTPMPAFSIRNINFVNAENEKISVGEDGEIVLTFRNIGAGSQNLNVTISTPNDGITIHETQHSIGAIASNSTFDLRVPFSLSQDFDLLETPVFRIFYQDHGMGYRDFTYREYEDLIYDIAQGNNLAVSIASDGTIGFTRPFDGAGGIGFRPVTDEPEGAEIEERTNMLYEAGLIITDQGKVFDAIRSTERTRSLNFRPLSAFKVTDSGISDSNGTGLFEYRLPGINPHLEIRMNSYMFNEAGLENTIFVQYLIKNKSQTYTVNNSWIGLFADWDIGNPGNNSVFYSEEDSLIFIGESGNPDTPVATVANLGPTGTLFAIDNEFEGDIDNLNFPIDESFTKVQKLNATRAGLQKTTVDETDASMIVSTGPHSIAPGEEISVGFVLAYGSSIEELQQQVANAREKNVFHVTGNAVVTSNHESSSGLPTRTYLYNNYPNPFNPSTNIRFDLAQSTNVQLTVYNILGQKVSSLVSENMTAGTHNISFDASMLSSGVYLAVLRTEFGQQTIKLNLIK
jgi:subtilisin family serine protease